MKKKTLTILSKLPPKDKNTFISDILYSVDVSLNYENINALVLCIKKWEDIVKENSMGKIRRQIWYFWQRQKNKR